jgi:putative DNA primase/helicase
MKPVEQRLYAGDTSSDVVIEQPGITERAAGVTLISGSDLKPEPIRWLWNGWLARGKLHVLAGAPGTGKTTIALALAATVTVGGRWPDGSRSELGSVLIWSGEDDPTDTLLPRLLAAGADPARVLFVGDVRAEGEIRSFDPALDMHALQIAAARIGDVRLMVVDPVVNAVAGDSHKNGEVRRALQPLVELSAKLDVAALGISHFSKGTAGRDPVERVTGSIAFGALPRVVMATAKVERDDGKQERLFARAKSNIGPDGGGFGYTIEQTELVRYPGLFPSRVLWGDPLEGSARDLLAVADTVADPEEHGALTETADWLHGLLDDEGELDKRDVMKLARANGFAERTIQRARGKLGILVSTSGFGREKRSYWRLPENSNRANRAEDSTSQESGTNGTNEAGDLENARERFEERAAIMEFDSGLNQQEAECKAKTLVTGSYRS